MTEDLENKGSYGYVDEQAFFERFSQLGKADTITLYMPAPINIPNYMIEGESGDSKTLGQLLFLLGEASEQFNGRGNITKHMLTYLGEQQGSNIAHNMKYAYRVLYWHLRNNGHDIPPTSQTLQSLGLDIPREIVDRLSRESSSEITH